MNKYVYVFQNKWILFEKKAHTVDILTLSKYNDSSCTCYIWYLKKYRRACKLKIKGNLKPNINFIKNYSTRNISNGRTGALLKAK